MPARFCTGPAFRPNRPPASWRTPQFERLALATQVVLERAIAAEGSTLGDGTYRNALNQDGGYQNEHRVYQKAGEQCPTCGKGRIERTMQAQRATFSCPRLPTLSQEVTGLVIMLFGQSLFNAKEHRMAKIRKRKVNFGFGPGRNKTTIGQFDPPSCPSFAPLWPLWPLPLGF